MDPEKKKAVKVAALVGQDPQDLIEEIKQYALKGLLRPMEQEFPRNIDFSSLSEAEEDLVYKVANEYEGHVEEWVTSILFERLDNLSEVLKARQ